MGAEQSWQFALLPAPRIVAPRFRRGAIGVRATEDAQQARAPTGDAGEELTDTTSRWAGDRRGTRAMSEPAAKEPPVGSGEIVVVDLSGDAGASQLVGW
jgi:hypothetical protein